MTIETEDDPLDQAPASPDPIVDWQPTHQRLAGRLTIGSAGALVAFGALAFGALAIGAVAIGALAIGRLAIGRVRLRDVEIDNLVVKKVSGLSAD
jgi:hypothetical protein